MRTAWLCLLLLLSPPDAAAPRPPPSVTPRGATTLATGSAGDPRAPRRPTATGGEGRGERGEEGLAVVCAGGQPLLPWSARGAVEPAEAHPGRSRRGRHRCLCRGRRGGGGEAPSRDAAASGRGREITIPRGRGGAVEARPGSCGDFVLCGGCAQGKSGLAFFFF